ncbi:MAG: hypothetical protein IAG13_17890 [Deltaproteobacteria bacterium]|nr:hypothetical protein [Nannocystaceae bacterium]
MTSRKLGKLGEVAVATAHALLLAACSGDDDARESSAWQPGDSADSGSEGPSDESSEGPGSGPVTSLSTSAGDEESSGADDPTESSSSEGPMCAPATTPCTAGDECCTGLSCDTTSLGQVCCGTEGIACATENGEDCCGSLLCIDGMCGFEAPSQVCEPACTEAPALVIEKNRLGDIGGTFLGICGDANHTYGYHVPAANLPSDDYSMQGAANVPVCEWHAAAIDVGMDWPVSREWLAWLIENIRDDDIQGIAEVIGSYDGVDVRYWSDSSGWHQEGEPYGGSGHDTHTHVSIYRSTALDDHGILLGWSGDAGPP